jgi:fumarate reductase flavoprotein subunit
MTGTVLEEGLRGAGGKLLGGDGASFMAKYDPRGDRATRDIVSRGIFEEIRRGNKTPNGGVWIEMKHLGPDNVRRLFKGMVERCADCGFDLAGDAMAAWVPAQGEWREPDEEAIAAATAHCRAPIGKPEGDIGALREALYELMWEDAGIYRDAAGLRRAEAGLTELGARLAGTGIAGSDLAFNHTRHDWLKLESLVLVSRANVAAALGREESRGAHFRTDFPAGRGEDDLAFTRVTLRGGDIALDWEQVRFTRVRPGQSLLRDAAA